MEYDVQKTFETAREFILEKYDLKLTLSDQVRLKGDYVEEIIPVAIANNSREDGYWIYPDYESATRFLQDCYGIAPFHVMVKIGMDEAGEYAKHLQEKFFRP